MSDSQSDSLVFATDDISDDDDDVEDLDEITNSGHPSEQPSEQPRLTDHNVLSQPRLEQGAEDQTRHTPVLASTSTTEPNYYRSMETSPVIQTTFQYPQQLPTSERDVAMETNPDVGPMSLQRIPNTASLPQQQSIFRRNPTVGPPIPRPEFVSINRPVSELPVTKCFTDNQLKIWKDFFNMKQIDSEDVFSAHDVYFKARTVLTQRGWVTITGHPGDGKTSIVEHMAISFLKKRPMFEVVQIHSHYDWVRKVNLKKKQVIVIDDIFGPASYAPYLVEPWLPYLDEIIDTATKNHRKTLVIVALHTHQLEKLQPHIRNHPLFQKKLVFNLNQEPYKYCDFDHTHILEKILKFVKSDDTRVEYVDEDLIRKVKSYSFPYAAKMFALVKSFPLQGHTYFINPDRSFDVVLQKVFNFDKNIQFILACTVLFDGKLQLDKDSFEDFDQEKQNVFRQMKMSLGIPDDVDLGKLRYLCTLLNGVFLKPVQMHQWEIVHERTFYQITESLMKTLSKKIIELCSLDFLLQRLRTQPPYGFFLESLHTVNIKDFNELAQRLTFELLKGNVRKIAAHPAFGDQRFAVHWVNFLSEMGTFSPVVEQRGDFNRSIFFWFAYYGNETAIEFLLLQDEDMEDYVSEEWFKEELDFLLFAACTGNCKFSERFIKICLDKGASLTSKENLTDEDMILLYGKDVFEVSRKQNGTLLHLTSMHGTHETIEILLQRGLEKNSRLEDGNTPLHLAAMHNNNEAITCLVNHKADLTIKNNLGNSPLEEAIRVGNGSGTKKLNAYGCQIKNTSKMSIDNRSLLAVAVGQEDLMTTETVLDGMDKPAIPKDTIDCWKALHEACALGNLKLVNLLLENEVSLNERCNGGWTPLHFAALFNHHKAAKALLEKGADVNPTSISGNTPLHIAAENGYFDMCNVLLEYGAKPESANTNGEYPMTLAAMNGYTELVKMFITEGWEMNYSSYRERDFMIRMMYGHHRMRDMDDFY